MSAFLTDTRHSLEGSLAHLVFGAASTILLARCLGTEGLGIYTFCAVFVAIASGVAQLGLTASTTYHIAQRQEPASPLGQVSLELSGVLGLLAAGTAIVLVVLLPDPFQGLTALLPFACLLIPIRMILTAARAILKGLSDFRLAGRNLAFGAAVQVIFILSLVWIGEGGIFGALVALLLGDFLALIAALHALRSHSLSFEPRLPARERRKLAGLLLAYGFRSYLGGFFSFLNYRLDKVILTALSGPAALGIYEVAVSLAERLWLLSTAAGEVLFSRVASVRPGDQSNYALTPILARSMLWTSLLVSIPLLALAEWMIALVFGAPYQSAGRVLQYMLPGVIVMSMTRPLAHDISGRGNPGLNSVQAGLALAVNIVSNLLLIPRYDALGAALATTISYSFLGIIKVRAYARIANVKWYQTCIPTRSDLRLWWRLLSQGVLSRPRLPQ